MNRQLLRLLSSHILVSYWPQLNLDTKVTKILYHWFLLLDWFRFWETHFTTYQWFVADQSAIIPSLGGVLWCVVICTQYIYTRKYTYIYTTMYINCRVYMYCIVVCCYMYTIYIHVTIYIHIHNNVNKLLCVYVSYCRVLLYVHNFFLYTIYIYATIFMHTTAYEYVCI